MLHISLFWVCFYSFIVSARLLQASRPATGVFTQPWLQAGDPLLGYLTASGVSHIFTTQGDAEVQGHSLLRASGEKQEQPCSSDWTRRAATHTNVAQSTAPGLLSHCWLQQQGFHYFHSSFISYWKVFWVCWMIEKATAYLAAPQQAHHKESVCMSSARKIMLYAK